jgi:hypothetical protein
MSKEDLTFEGILQRFDSATEPVSEHDVDDAWTSLNKQLRAAGIAPSDDVRAETIAFMFAPGADNEDVGWGTYYGPSTGLQDEQGNISWSPHLKSVTLKMIEYWAGRAERAKHPVPRIRYADLVWDFARKIDGAKADVRMARIVVDATIDAVTRNLIEHEVLGFERLSRALDVALSISDQARVDAVRDAIIAYEDAVAEDDTPGLWGFSFDLLLEGNKITLSEAQRQKIVTDLEGRLARLVTPGEGSFPDHFSAEAAALRLARHYRRSNQPEEMKRVLRSYGQAVWTASEKPDAMIGSAWLRHAHNAYQQFEMREEAATIARRMRELDQKIPAQMATHTQEIRIAKEQLDRIVAEITPGGLDAALDRMAVAFVPTNAFVLDALKKAAKQSVLLAMTSLTKVDHKGRPIAVIGPIKDDLPGRIAYQTAELLRINGIWLYKVLDRIHELYHPTADDYLGHLSKSPAFQPEKLPLIKAGLSAYLAGDMVAAAHILIPQFEDAVRTLVELTRGTIYKSHRAGGFILKNLDELLREETVIKTLGEDAARYLSVVYTDQRGWNLRNDVCHGLEPAAGFGRPICDRIVHTLLLLGTLRPGSSGNEGPSQAESGPQDGCAAANAVS